MNKYYLLTFAAGFIAGGLFIHFVWSVIVTKFTAEVAKLRTDVADAIKPKS